MILVLRALGVGDLATAVPALRGLRAAHPGRELALAAPAWLAPLVDLVGGVDRLVPADGLDALRVPGLPPDPAAPRVAGSPPGPADGPAAPRVPGPPPDLAVNLHGRGPQSHRALAATRPARLLAFANPDAGHLDGPDWRDDEHEVDRWCRLLAWYGIPADRADLALRRPAPGRTPPGVTVVHPGSKVAVKRWPARRFAAVARELAGRGHRVVVTGSADERALARSVASAANLAPGAVLAGRTDLGDLAAVVAYARLVVSGDTGVAHLATGYGTPSVVLFGPVPPARWGPPPDRPWHRALWAGARPADPGPAAGGPAPAGVRPGTDGVRTDPMAALGVEEVLAAVDEAERAVRISGAVTA
ncbi:glycosyltransferase family 9 protein [Micromonospora okii]|uniref:glycosyltransferase family 9 protein n=1 Tax=Micromonospora okii TaxID=1182970 RepID=UPI001E403778|nr:glycosyltransferase family 9 protein [Micromonospora okii]